MSFRMLVTGSRDFDDQRTVDVALDEVFANCRGGMVLLHGDSKGADACANAWAMAKRAVGASVGIHRWPADWRKHGNSSEGLRNQRMIDEGKPQLVVAFGGDARTRDCVKRAQTAGIKVVLVANASEAQLA